MVWTTDTIFVGNYFIAKGFERDTEAPGPWSTYRNTADGTVYRPNRTDGLPNGQEFEVINKDGERIGTAAFTDVNNLDHRNNAGEEHKITVIPNGEKPPEQPKKTDNSNNTTSPRPARTDHMSYPQPDPSTSHSPANKTTNPAKSTNVNNASDKTKAGTAPADKAEPKPDSKNGSILASNTKAEWEKAIAQVKNQFAK